MFDRKWRLRSEALQQQVSQLEQEKRAMQQELDALRSLQQSSQKGVEAFMLYAYRGMPSPELGEYVALYQQPAVKKLLDATLKALPEVFAAQRQQLK